MANRSKLDATIGKYIMGVGVITVVGVVGTIAANQLDSPAAVVAPAVAAIPVAPQAPPPSPAPVAEKVAAEPPRTGAETNEKVAMLREYMKPPADHSASSSYQKEWWMVVGAIRQKGYPCAAVSYVTQMADGTFKAICKYKLHTNKFVAFGINPDTHSITWLG